MKAGCWTTWILQDRTIGLFCWEHVLFFKAWEGFQKWIGDHQGCPSILKGGTITLLSTGQTAFAQSYRGRAPRQNREGTAPAQQSLTDLHSGGSRSQDLHPRRSEGQIISQKRLFLSHNISWSFPCYIFDLLGTHHPFLPSCFSVLKWECLSYAWKQINYPNSQVHNWRGTWPQDEPIKGTWVVPKSDLDDSYMRLWTLDFLVDPGTI